LAAVLAALHDVDAIRLAPDGTVRVAYPFSATPTRHRVRIGRAGPGGVDVYAMCAIDALGIAAMLDQDTLIESVDVTTGRPLTVTTTGGHTIWEPATAVVFIGTAAGDGPSADCCCDYLNFFADRTAGEAWPLPTRKSPDRSSSRTRPNSSAPGCSNRSSHTDNAHRQARTNKGELARLR
jgi:hypothetical protein